MRRIAVLGSGLAGICATTALETQLEGRRHIELTHVSETTHFVYRPLLPHVVSGTLETTALSVPLDDVFESSTDIVVERIRHVDPDDRVIAGQDRDIPFDYLIIAPPMVVDWGGNPTWRETAHPFQTLGDAADIRRTLAEAPLADPAPVSRSPEDDGRDEQIVVVGAGPNGLELASELEWALARTDHSEGHVPNIVLVDRNDELLADWPTPMQKACRADLSDRGIRLLGGLEVVDCRDDGLELADGEHVRAESRLESSLFWCGGVRPPSFLRADDIVHDDTGRVAVDDDLSVPDHYGLYAAGPVASPPTVVPSSPGAAAEQGRRAAGNLLAELSGRTPNPFEINDPTWALSLGPDAAAVYRQGALVDGPAGWALYRLLHTSLIPSALKKVGLLGAWLQEGLRRASE